MSKITVNGEFDHLFFDDRIAALSGLTGKDRILQYGENSLYPPIRKLTSEEMEKIENMGLPQRAAK
jgi:hypothetical protein